MEDVGDADSLSGREEERRQDRSSLHHSSVGRRGRRGHGWEEGTGRERERGRDRKRDKERERESDCMGRGEKGKERE